MQPAHLDSDLSLATTFEKGGIVNQLAGQQVRLMRKHTCLGVVSPFSSTIHLSFQQPAVSPGLLDGVPKKVKGPWKKWSWKVPRSERPEKPAGRETARHVALQAPSAQPTAPTDFFFSSRLGLAAANWAQAVASSAGITSPKRRRVSPLPSNRFKK